MTPSKILVVDDLPANITAMETILKPLDVHIMKAHSGEEALKLLIRHDFAVIVLDVQMPVMDGFETAELIRHSNNGEYAPIIFVTAIDKDQSRVIEAYGTGAVDFLFKPVNPIQLRAKVKVFLDLDEQKNSLRDLLAKREDLLRTITDQNDKRATLIRQNTRLKAQSKLWLAIACLMVICAGFFVYNFRISEENVRLEDLNEQMTQLNQSYQRFIPHEFTSLLGKKSIKDIRLGDQVLQAMAVMFFDMSGFTSMTEHMSAKEMVTLMNDVFSAVQPAIIKNHGIINKYLGDGAMVIFPTGENDAVQAGIEMIRSIASLNKKRIKNGLKPLLLGIGIDSGPMILGTVGEAKRLEYTVYGNTVNLASRVEGLTRQYGVNLLITENVYSRTNGKTRKNVRIVDNVRVKGKSGVITIYEAFGGDVEKIPSRNKTLSHYLKGFNLYQRGAFKNAITAFQQVVHIDQSDDLAKYHLLKCKDLMQGKHANWEPIETFSVK